MHGPWLQVNGPRTWLSSILITLRLLTRWRLRGLKLVLAAALLRNCSCLWVMSCTWPTFGLPDAGSAYDTTWVKTGGGRCTEGCDPPTLVYTSPKLGDTGMPIHQSFWDTRGWVYTKHLIHQTGIHGDVYTPKSNALKLPRARVGTGGGGGWKKKRIEGGGGRQGKEGGGRSRREEDDKGTEG